MHPPVRLRLHVSEPFDFERANGFTDLYGTTRDHHHAEAEEWLLYLEDRFTFNEHDYDAVVVAPRYIGEHLSRVFDSFMGFSVRIAHKTPDGWHFAMTGMLSLAPPETDNHPNDTPADNKGF